ncbi:MAG TPA: GH92 family glycosyl hydrolase [Cytophagaceae bacterium]|jgi:predicted alpha-1,2-mannosidase
MIRPIIKLIFLAIVLFSSNVQSQTPVASVNPFIGTGGHGHTFPGPTRPFGLVQLSPDNRLDGWDWCSGYHYSDSVMLGFSHTHLSGTGIGDLGDVLLCPQVGRVNFVPGSYANPDTGYAFRFSHSEEKAEVGYYSVFNKDDSINIELTTTARVGMHRYTFPETDKANVIIDLGSTIGDVGRKNIIESQLQVVDNQTLQGYKIIKGWAPLRKVFFYIQFSKPFDKYGSNESGYKQNVSFIRNSWNGVASSVTFSTKAGEKILAKVAISFVSIANAKLNSSEITDWDFEKVVRESKSEWNFYLSKVEIDGKKEQKEIFYTGLYHSMIQPNNIADGNGDYYGPDYQVHKSSTGNYYSTFSLWDTYRAVHPLYTILVPDRVGDMANTMIEHFKHNGYLPIWTLGGTENHCMVGNHSIPVLSDAIGKNIKGFDYQEAYNAMKSSSINDHRDSNRKRNKYDQFGYMPLGLDWQSATKTMDFSYDDWCVAQTAKKLGNTEDYDFFTKRAAFYKNQFNPEHGLVWPVDINGRFKPDFDPAFIQWDSDFMEGNAWQYTFLVQHDPLGLMDLYKSRANFVEKLDEFFLETNVPKSSMPDVEPGKHGQYVHSNEPCHHIGYLYNYAGQPQKTQELINTLLNSEYTTTPTGVPGNEDCGQMSSWYVFNAMGLYPYNPASGNYDFGSPILKKAKIHLEDDKKFIILAPNVNEKNIYIQSIRLNGKPYNKLYINHADMMAGGVLVFEMGDKPQKLLTTYQVPGVVYSDAAPIAKKNIKKAKKAKKKKKKNKRSKIKR